MLQNGCFVLFFSLAVTELAATGDEIISIFYLSIRPVNNFQILF